MAGSTRVLKFNRSDNDSQYVLLHVVFKGPNPLDLRIQATEGDAEYAATFKHDRIASQMAKNSPISDSEWQEIVLHLLQQDPQQGIQATATVSADSSISILIRKSTQGITQRLGELTIPAVPGGELNVLDWCATAADTAAENKKAAADAIRQVEKLGGQVSDLSRQIDEFIQAKEQDEETLFLKFRDLLNEKKVKIRELQKIIASTGGGANTGSTSPTQPSQAPPPTPSRGRRADQSRTTKRKASDLAAQAGGLETMEVDQVKSDPDSTGDGGETEATASTASDEDEESAANSYSGASQAQLQQSEAAPPAKAQAQQPPKRNLPFAKAKPPANITKAPAEADSETDSDDEL